MNRNFQQDLGSVYSNFNKMLAKEPENDRPVYDNTVPQEKQNGAKLANVEEACGFWKELWEKEGTGDVDVEWIDETRIAMEDIVPNLTKEEFKVNSCDAGKIISGKRNWSAPGSDRITTFWWKKACVLHDGVAKSFQATVHQAQFPLRFSGVRTTPIPKPGDLRKKTNVRSFALTPYTSGTLRAC